MRERGVAGSKGSTFRQGKFTDVPFDHAEETLRYGVLTTRRQACVALRETMQITIAPAAQGRNTPANTKRFNV